MGKIRLGYWDQSSDQESGDLIEAARAEGGFEIQRFGEIPSASREIPGIFCLYPPLGISEGSLDTLRECIEAHPRTKFSLMLPDDWTDRQSNRLGEQTNLEYVSCA